MTQGSHSLTSNYLRHLYVIKEILAYIYMDLQSNDTKPDGMPQQSRLRILFRVGNKTRQPAGLFNPSVSSSSPVSQTRIGMRAQSFTVTPSVLRSKSSTKICNKHHIYMLMHVIKCVDNFYNSKCSTRMRNES